MKRTEGYEPRFDINVEEGDIGEELVEHLPAKRIEVKRKSYLDSKVYVEYEHDPGRSGYFAPSGIATTEADYWVYVIASTGVAIWIPTALLRAGWGRRLGRKAAETDGSCPTHGRLMDLDSLLGFSVRLS